MKKAFTLIELLVVVLIIGILTAIALPQYQKAVVKSRYAGMKPLVHAIAAAEKVYYLSNGSYTSNFDDLDVQLPQHTSETSDDRRVTRYFDWGRCYLEDKMHIVCISRKAKMRYYVDFVNNIRKCWANNIDLDSAQNQVCKAETGRKTYSDQNEENNFTVWRY